jgi:ubiquinone biosynthesis protein Coq4
MLNTNAMFDEIANGWYQVLSCRILINAIWHEFLILALVFLACSCRSRR